MCLLMNLAGYLAAVDELPEACAAAREAIRDGASRDPGDTFVTLAIEHLALALVLGDDTSRAATLAGYAGNALQREGYTRGFSERTSHDRLTTLLRERLAPDPLARVLAEGAALTPEAAVALALEEP